jgi:hypothetical protein
MESYKSTKEVAAKLRIKPQTLSMALWSGRCPRPAQSPGGDFLWSEIDIIRAIEALNIRPLDIEGISNAVS